MYTVYFIFFQVASATATKFGLSRGLLGLQYVTHLDETSHMSAEFVFRYGLKCMGGLILPILVLLHLYLLKYVNYHMAKYHI